MGPAIDLDLFYVYGLIAFGALSHFELNFLTLFKRFIAGSVNSRMMYEYILSAIFTGHEAITLSIVKPLHCSCFHVFFLLSDKSHYSTTQIIGSNSRDEIFEGNNWVVRSFSYADNWEA